VICERLLAHGMPAATPAATIERATRSDQRTLVATLADLPAVARLHDVKPPALIIIGGVVSLHAQLAAVAYRAANLGPQEAAGAAAAAAQARRLVSD
jgi:siroheme synthase